jgi:hypothetical protein
VESTYIVSPGAAALYAAIALGARCLSLIGVAISFSGQAFSLKRAAVKLGNATLRLMREPSK